MTVAPDPVFPKASGGVMAEGKEASCERGSGAEVVHTSAKDANRRDEIQEIPMTDTDVSGRKCGKCGLPIHPSEIGIRHFGFFVAHSEGRCIELLKAEIARLRSPVSAPVSDVNAELVAALKPFATAFEKARDKYAKRYRDHELGYRNFDKMPDEWAMDSLEFNMGAFRAARAALSRLSPASRTE